MAGVSKKDLCQALECDVISFFRSCGFAQDAGREIGSDPEFETAFPFGTLRRRRSDLDFDLLEIQFDKRGKKKFVLNFGIGNQKGVTTTWGDDIFPEAITPSDLPLYYRLHSSKVFWRWFYVDTTKDLQKVRARMKGIVEDVNKWFFGGVLPANCRAAGFGA